MNCFNEGNEAKGFCCNCGKALCVNCIKPTATNKIACSDQCISAISETELAVSMTLQKAVNGAFASAYGSFLLGFIMLIFAFFSKDSFLQIYMGAFGIGLILFGSLYLKVAKSKKKLTSH